VVVIGLFVCFLDLEWFIFVVGLEWVCVCLFVWGFFVCAFVLVVFCWIGFLLECIGGSDGM